VTLLCWGDVALLGWRSFAGVTLLAGVMDRLSSGGWNPLF